MDSILRFRLSSKNTSISSKIQRPPFLKKMARFPALNPSVASQILNTKSYNYLPFVLRRNELDDEKQIIEKINNTIFSKMPASLNLDKLFSSVRYINEL